MQNIRSIITLYLGTALIVSLPLSGAFAGFEWTPPVTQSAVPEMRAMPAPDVNTEILPSITSQRMTTQPAPAQQDNVIAAPAATHHMGQYGQHPRMPQYRPVPQAAPQPALSPPQQDIHFETVQGFGADIPLVLVLSQIVPPAYSYSFDPGINQGMSVSWTGGRPWNEVLKDAVAPQGLTVTIIDGVVWIRKDAPDTASSAPALPMNMIAAQEIGMMPPPAAATQTPADTDNTPDFAADRAAPVPLTNSGSSPQPLSARITEEQITEEHAYTQSYPRRIRPAISRSHGLADNLAHDRTHDLAKPPVAPHAPQTDSGTMPIPLMPFKKAGSGAGGADSYDATAPAKSASSAHNRSIMPADSISRRADSDKDTSTASQDVTTRNTPSMPRPPAMAADINTDSTHATQFASQLVTTAPQDGALDPFEVFYWQAARGENLRDVLTRWSNEANVSLVWSAEPDYALREDIEMHDTFPDVIAKTLGQFSGQNSRPVGKLHPNLPMGPSVLSIETYIVATTH